FEDIKDIRYGKIGGLNSNCNTANKWIKVSSFTISGAWDPRGFTLEVYPRIRYNSSSRQTLVCLVRNGAGNVAAPDIEAPYVSLNTHNEGEPNSRLIKDVRVIRTSGSGISDNTIEVWIQFMEPCADSSYVMYYLYNFKTNDFIATTPQAQVDNPPSGQAWGISERIEPQNGKTTLTGAKGSGWGTAINVNAPQQPESLYSLHFGDGTDLHGRQAGMGYIKDQPNRIWGNTRGTLGMHVHQDDDFHLYSTGWTPLFSVKGGSGNTYVKGKILEKKNRARYIRVGNTDATLRKDSWTLIELRAYDHDGTNVSQGKPVKILQGSAYSMQNSPPQKIVDGRIFDNPAEPSENWWNGYHGLGGVNQLEIDLGEELDLSQIELFNRWSPTITSRMDGTTVELVGADRTINRIIYTGLWHEQYSKEYLL
ncbi:hypothetical protein EB001_26340, partial [bacterium]|nr:hypothetical protein [bacterium]